MSGLGGVEVAVLFFIIPFAMLVYAIPTIVAVVRNHHQAVGILVVNVLLGVTMIGWVAALIWAAATPARPAREADAQRACSRCGLISPASAKFCSGCGTALAL